jgi:hypothetical protein
MTARPLRDSDIQQLTEIAEKTGFPYPDLRGPHIEGICVVEDEHGNIVAACAAKRLLELYLYCPEGKAINKSRAIILLHEKLAAELKIKGYDDANVFLPPTLAEKFGRRLERSFGWVKAWPSWTKRF